MNNKNHVPLEVIERWLKDSDCDVRQAAMNACQGRDVPLKVIELGLKDSDWRVSQAAMNACQGRDVPLEVIERWLKDSDCDVRQAAMKLWVEKGNTFPLIRNFEPPNIVYKKCIGGVIVYAEIPKYAQVRGQVGKKCRANVAKIVDIVGSFGGEKIGVSLYDNRVAYFIGDEIEIGNFDMSDNECSTGFHFFCSLEEAESW